MSKPVAEPLAIESPRMMALSAIVLGALSFCALVASPAPARAEVEYPWCVQYTGSEGDNGVNCGFVTLEQCQATASGAGFCYENPAYPAAPPPPRRKTRKPR